MDDPRPTIEQLAAITDAEQVADIRAAADGALARFDAWRRSPAWDRDNPACRRLGLLVDLARLVLDDLPADADLSTVINTVTPLLNAWWPSYRQPEVVMSAAIERLRYYAVKRPSFIRQARLTTGVEDSNGPGPMRSW